MIDLDFLEKLIRALDESGLDHLEIERGGTRVRISRTPVPIVVGGGGEGVSHLPAGAPPAAPAPSAAPPASEAASGKAAAPAPKDTLVEVTSPMVGTFYRAPSPDTDPFTDVGKRIAKGDVLCIIEAMKLMNEFEGDVDGIVREICVSNGEPVEYGQVLFRVEPD